jgi:hypothetical protein
MTENSDEKPELVSFKGRDGLVVHQPDADATITGGNARKPAKIRKGRASRLLPKNWIVVGRQKGD